MKKMRSWQDKVLLLAEKENAMERRDYDRKVRELLDDTSTYCKPPKDITPIQKLEAAHNGKQIMVQQTQTPAPRQIHKPSVPLFHALDHPPKATFPKQ